MNRRDSRMHGGNRFKIGVFAPNCSGGLTMTTAPEAWVASWENNVKLARLADEIGLEFILPVARWHGYGGKTNTEGSAFETLTWASGLLALTHEIVIFGTVHVPLINPVWAAKQVVTADHIGAGRFGLNVVSGWNESEFQMFGVEMREHDERYVFTEEWLSIVKRIWAEEEPFAFKGRYFDLRQVMSSPKPYGGTRPIIMSAGSSTAGREFARRNVDCLFMIINKLDTLAGEIRALREGIEKVGVFASGHVVCRPTQKEAEDYYHYIVHEKGDWDAVEHLVKIRANQKSMSVEDMKKIKERLISGLATYALVGSPDKVAQSFKTMSDAGLDGMAVGFVNYLNDLPLIRDEVLPRMARLGIRGTLEPGRKRA
jgi:alkanesulfonate monooxygenase SsuD/methylene tetrahydromethanopterin reductase-like flavin-dependent oxidoreductase (luciferase family)